MLKVDVRIEKAGEIRKICVGGATLRQAADLGRFLRGYGGVLI